MAGVIVTNGLPLLRRASRVAANLGRGGRLGPRGRIKHKEDVSEGLENAPRELIGVLRGEHFEKKIARVGK